MIRLTCLALLALGAASAASADVGVSLNFAQPGLYGSVGIGAFPAPVMMAPPVIYAPAPVLMAPSPYYVAPQPVLYAPAWYGSPYVVRRGHWHGGHEHGHHHHD